MVGALGAVGLVLLGAVLAVVVPRSLVWFARIRNGGPLAYSLTVFNGPLILYPGDPPESAPIGEFGIPALPTTGTAFGWQTAHVTLRGLDSRPVVITSIEPVVLSREDPLAGWFVAPEIGGGEGLHFMVSDLDRANARFTLVDGSSDRLVNRYVFRASATDVEHIELEVFTTSARIRWGFDIHFDAAGAVGVLQIRDERLDLTAEGPGASAYVWQGRWEHAWWGPGFAAERAERWRQMPTVDYI